jgi:cytochrome c-type biogenesis protein CcmH
MTLFVALGALLALLTLVLLTRPLWRRGGAVALRQQQEQLAALKQSGVLSAAQYDDARQALDMRIAEAGAAAPSQTAGSKPLLLGVATFVSALTVAGYAWLGTPHALNSELAAAAAAPANPDRPVTQEQIEAMVGTLSARVKAQPDDAESWAMLGRAQVVLGKHAEAVPALKQAVALRRC